MTASEYDPELYKEIWGEYPAEEPPSGAARASEPAGAAIDAISSVGEEIVVEARLIRETVLAALDPRLDALELRLSAIESRLEGIERELKELINRGVDDRQQIDDGGYRGLDAAQ